MMFPCLYYPRKTDFLGIYHPPHNQSGYNQLQIFHNTCKFSFIEKGLYTLSFKSMSVFVYPQQYLYNWKSIKICVGKFKMYILQGLTFLEKYPPFLKFLWKMN